MLDSERAKSGSSIMCQFLFVLVSTFVFLLALL